MSRVLSVSLGLMLAQASITFLIRLFHSIRLLKVAFVIRGRTPELGTGWLPVSIIIVVDVWFDDPS